MIHSYPKVAQLAWAAGFFEGEGHISLRQGKRDPYPHATMGVCQKDVEQDVIDECAEEIRDELWKHAKPQIVRMVTRGLPEWWKQKLAERQQGAA